MVYYLSSRRPENNGYAMDMSLESLKNTKIDSKVAGEIPAIAVLVGIPLIVWFVMFLMFAMVKPSFCCVDVQDSNGKSTQVLSKTKAMFTSMVIGLAALGGTYVYMREKL